MAPDPTVFMNHGGFSTDDTNIACLISVNGAQQKTINETTANPQVTSLPAPCE